jgi:hypothetical protein
LACGWDKDTGNSSRIIWGNLLKICQSEDHEGIERISEKWALGKDEFDDNNNNSNKLPCLGLCLGLCNVCLILVML